MYNYNILIYEYDSMAYLATWAFCSGVNFMYGLLEGSEPCFELHSDMMLIIYMDKYVCTK